MYCGYQLQNVPISSGEALPEGEGELQLEHIPAVEIFPVGSQQALYGDILLWKTDPIYQFLIGKILEG